MKKLLYFYLKIFFLISVVLAFVAVWNYTLIFGWLFSGISVLASFFSKHFFLKRIVIKIKTEKTTFFKGFFAYLGLILFQGLILISIYFINKKFQKTNANSIFGIFSYPVNIFSFIFGYTIFPVCAIIINSINIKVSQKQKKEK
ncbi:hypothetical protein EHI52_00480 [Mesomycoplasma hyopneumoniae]|nr:hypothetical protein EHI52_00480 [Mesomycoplasma hyopneumoniae]